MQVFDISMKIRHVGFEVNNEVHNELNIKIKHHSKSSKNKGNSNEVII